MPTVETSIERALLARAATLPLSPALPIAWPNEHFPGLNAGGAQKPLPKSYLEVTHFPNKPDRIFISDQAHERRGILQVSLRTPIGEGPDAAREIAGRIAEHFAVDTRLARDGIAVRIYEAPEVHGGLAEDNHWHIPISVRYEAFA